MFRQPEKEAKKKEKSQPKSGIRKKADEELSGEKIVESAKSAGKSIEREIKQFGSSVTESVFRPDPRAKSEKKAAPVYTEAEIRYKRLSITALDLAEAVDESSPQMVGNSASIAGRAVQAVTTPGEFVKDTARDASSAVKARAGNVERVKATAAKATASAQKNVIGEGAPNRRGGGGGKKGGGGGKESGPKPTHAKARATHDYQGRNDKELKQMRVGDDVRVISEEGAHWVVVECRGKKGRVPRRYLKFIDAGSRKVTETMYLDATRQRMVRETEGVGSSEVPDGWQPGMDVPAPGEGARVAVRNSHLDDGSATCYVSLTERMLVRNPEGGKRYQTYSLHVRWGDCHWMIYRRFSQIYEFWQHARRHGISFPHSIPNRDPEQSGTEAQFLLKRDMKLKKFVRGINDIMDELLESDYNQRMFIRFVAPIQIGDVKSSPNMVLPFKLDLLK